MKRISLFIISIFCFFGTSLFAQETNILLFPQYGNKLVYEFTESTYLQTEEGEKLNEFLRTKILEVEYKTTAADNRKLLLVTITKNIATKPEEKPFMFRDYEYPVFKDGFYGDARKDFHENLVCNVLFKYEFNEETSEVKLYNRDEILMDINKSLNEKGFNKTTKDRRIEDFNTEAIPAINKYVQSIYQVSSEMLDPKEYDMKLEFGKPVSTIIAKRWDKKPGVYERNYSINMEERYLKEYQQVELDSAKRRTYAKGDYHSLIYKEKNIKLVDINEKEGTRLSISGTVENLLNKKVTLAFLRKPYGTELYQETVFLDEDNSFHIETEFEHAGLVFLVFGQTTSTIALPTIPLYAEPGSSIQLQTSGGFPWEIEYSGDFAGTQKLLYNFNKEHNWLKQKVNFHSLNWWWLSQIDYSDLTKAIDNFDSFTSGYKEMMPKYVFDFVSNELKANLMSGVLNFLSNLEYNRRMTWGRSYLKDEDLIDKNYLDEALNATEIHEIYNPYGMFSRQFANSYLLFHFGIMRKVNDVDYFGYRTAPGLSTGLRFYGDLPQKIEVAKILLSGPALYGQIANMLVREKTKVYNKVTKDVIYRQHEVEKYFDLIVRVCNDREFTQSLKTILNTHSLWDRKDYVPDTKFFNENGNPKFLKDFFGQKPTLFYITERWARERYFFDDLAKKNPDINFVLIAEGSSIQEWMDYTKRAESVANQLFLINHKEQLNAIFKSSSHHFVSYDKNGVRIGFEGNMVSAMNLCKQSLTPKKKELDKSKLLTIVIVLSFVLTTLIIGLLTWKWRVRQRFRKEEQFRRLRELELTSIRSQMNPHFLFNALNSVQNLVQQNKGREAHLYLSDFAGLIRKVLRNSEKEEVSLAEELEMTRQYLNLEKLRFEFDFTISVDEKIDLHNTMVPSMLLQPIVENAVTHGLQNKLGERKLGIDIILQKSSIQISIEDNGIGREAAQKIEHGKNGKGSKLVQERLNILQEKQGEKYSMETVDLENENGTRVEILIPEEK